jgi:hypothetical protein
MGWPESNVRELEICAEYLDELRQAAKLARGKPADLYVSSKCEGTGLE